MYAHHHELGPFTGRSRVTEYDSSDPTRDVDRYTDVIVLRSTDTPQSHIGDEPRRYIGGTVWTRTGLERDLPYVLDGDFLPDGNVWIQAGLFWFAFRTCDVRYPVPTHVRLQRGEPLHDADLRSAVRWD